MSPYTLLHTFFGLITLIVIPSTIISQPTYLHSINKTMYNGLDNLILRLDPPSSPINSKSTVRALQSTPRNRTGMQRPRRARMLAQENIDTILRDPKTLVSSNAVFRLGFFSPTNSTNRYVGIWYNQRDSYGKLVVVWVANRERPLNDTSGVLNISEDGNLIVSDGQNKRVWSSNVPANESRNLVFRLEDTGNLVLLSNVSGEIIWQSFDHPTDVFLPEMSFTIDSTLTEKQVLFQSWKSLVDASGGNYTFGVDTRVPPQVAMWDGDKPLWRSETWNGSVFIDPNSVLTMVVDAGKIYLRFSLVNRSENLLHLAVNYDGSLVERGWDAGSKKWETVWNWRKSECDVFGKCGAFGSCKATNSPICDCLKGFVPRNITEWSKGNWTSGCIRRSELQCGAVGDKADGFWKLGNVKVPDNAQWFSAATEDECNNHCTEECSCLAYAYMSGIGCMTWNGSLIDIQEFTDYRGYDIFVRLAYTELGASRQQQKHPISDSGKSRSWIIIVAVVVSITAVVFGIPLLHRQYGTRITQKANIDEFGDLPMFEFEKLVTATNNFHDTNRLGRGGFGTVYKGKLEDGDEIAVKRLSKLSGQGLPELMTEVLVISKLQHRNLVRLLGCCVEGEEKLLVYEYMPNKSLDALLFDQNHQESLGWKTRFNIIRGISRGILYLHRDSRLRIIHRDLKASNILLDDKLSPKISDFGMAKIFGGNEDQAATNRVVGTYGYMSPEYAMAGRFSEKSDVFSFGVLLLEIVSGRRNSSFHNEESLCLIAHAWDLWIADDIVSLIDPVISGSGFQDEISRCVQVALLCVQELPEDRPNMSMVISMIDCEISDLPRPEKPGFTQRRYAPHNHGLVDEIVIGSVNRISLSQISGR